MVTGGMAEMVTVAALVISVGILFKSRPGRVRYLQAPKPVSVRIEKLGGDQCLWAGRALGFDQARQHFAVVGSSGSGKTTALLMLMNSVLPKCGKHDGHRVRAVVYDSKADLISQIAGMESASHGRIDRSRITIMNPLDARSWAWNMAADLKSPADIQEAAEVLIPTGKESQPYFADTARAFLRGLMTAFSKRAGEAWEFRDLILASETPQRLYTVFDSDPSTRVLIDAHFHGQPNPFSSVFSTLSTALDKYRPVAAAWHAAAGQGRSLSLEEWVQGESILVLGNKKSASEFVRTVNTLIFSFLAKQVLDLPGYAERNESWFFLDELTECGRLPELRNLINSGRSKGAALVLGFQDTPGLERVYGREEAREILGAAQNVGILHINHTAPETQEWASKVLGKHQFVRTEKSEGSSGNLDRTTSNVGFRDAYVTEPVWHPSRFATDLSKSDRVNGLFGFFDLSVKRPIHVAPRQLLTSLPRPDVEVADLIGQRRKAMELIPWSEEDIERLGIPDLNSCDSATIRQLLHQEGNQPNEGALSRIA